MVGPNCNNLPCNPNQRIKTFTSQYLAVPSLHLHRSLLCKLQSQITKPFPNTESQVPQEPKACNFNLRTDFWGSNNGGLGPSIDRSGAVYPAATGAALLVPGKQQAVGVWAHEDQRQGHRCPHSLLLRSLCHSHPGRPRPHLYRLILLPSAALDLCVCWSVSLLGCPVVT